MALALGGTVARGWVLGGVLRFAGTTGTFNGGPGVVVTETQSVNGTNVTTMSPARGNSTAVLINLGPFIEWYPDPNLGWHVGASVGLGGVGITDDGGRNIDSVAVSLSAFGGYQWWLGPRWSLGLQAVVLGTPNAKLTDSSNNDSGYRMGGVAFGLEGVLLYY